MIQSTVLEVSIGLVLLIAGYFLGLFQEAMKKRKHIRDAVGSILVELDQPISEMSRHIHGFQGACKCVDNKAWEYCQSKPIFDIDNIEKRIKNVEYFTFLPGKYRKDLLHGARIVDECFTHFNTLKASQRLDPITVNKWIDPHRLILANARDSILIALKQIKDRHTADADRPSLIAIIEVVERANI